MSHSHTNPPVLSPGEIRPLLLEAPDGLRLRLCERPGYQRRRLERFVRILFARHYGARVNDFSPLLFALESGSRLIGVVGVREATAGRLFSEHYLDRPAEQIASEHAGVPVARGELVEVGNLALAQPGQARLVIAAMTGFLYGAGFRWVLFTAVAPLFNAFRRMGLEPVDLGPARPERLPGGGRTWGSYYRQSPRVCLGSIDQGYARLEPCLAAHPSRVYRLWLEARVLGMKYHLNQSTVESMS